MGTFERFQITNNVFNNTGGYVGYQGNIVDARQCNIDGNVYLGKQRWLMGLAQASSPVTKSIDCTSYATYLAALHGLPNCTTWEKNSRVGSTSPRFDFATFDTFLDTDPPLAAVLPKIRRYVQGVIAPFPGVGPVIKGPVARDHGEGG